MGAEQENAEYLKPNCTFCWGYLCENSSSYIEKLLVLSGSLCGGQHNGEK